MTSIHCTIKVPLTIFLIKDINQRLKLLYVRNVTLQFSISFLLIYPFFKQLSMAILVLWSMDIV